MRAAACRDEGPEFGTPGHIDWVRHTLNESAVNLREGFPAGSATHFVGTKLDVFDVLTRGGVIAPHYPGLDWRPEALAPHAAVYVQVVRPPDLWEDPIEVLAFETVVEEAIAVGCEFDDVVEFVLAADTGGHQLLDALNCGSTPPRVVGRGSRPIETVAVLPEPEQPDQEQPKAPRLAESGYTDWFIAELARNGVSTVDEPPDDWRYDSRDPEFTAVPSFSAARFIQEAKAAGASVLIDRDEVSEEDSEDSEPGPPMTWAGFYNDGRVRYVVAFDEGGVAARAELAGMELAHMEALETLEDDIPHRVKSVVSSLTSLNPSFKRHPAEARERSWNHKPAVVPTPAALAEEADDYRAEVAEWAKHTRSPDDRYIDFSTGSPVPQRYRSLVDAIVHDPSYSSNLDPDERDRVVRQHAGHLTDEEYDLVTGAAYYTFKYTIGKVISHHSLPWARDLAAHPEVRAEWKGAELERWVSSQLPQGMDPRLAQEISWELQRRLRRRANAARLLAEDLYSRITPEVLDRVGFTSSRDDRHALLSEVVVGLPAEIRRLASEHVIAKERKERSQEREQRYATAGRAMLASGLTNAATARKLGISPAVLKRLITSCPQDVTLTQEDPLLALLTDCSR